MGIFMDREWQQWEDVPKNWETRKFNRLLRGGLQTGLCFHPPHYTNICRERADNILGCKSERAFMKFLLKNAIEYYEMLCDNPQQIIKRPYRICREYCQAILTIANRNRLLNLQCIVSIIPEPCRTFEGGVLSSYRLVFAQNQSAFYMQLFASRCHCTEFTDFLLHRLLLDLEETVNIGRKLAGIRRVNGDH